MYSLWTPSVKEFWLQFLELYKTKRCLWDVNSVEYSNKPKRREAYDDLARFAITVHPEADIHFIKSRINNVRRVYRKEKNRVLRERESGTVYKPQLFYFDLLNSFLNQDNSLESEPQETYSVNTSDEEDPFACLETPVSNNDRNADESNLKNKEPTKGSSHGKDKPNHRKNTEKKPHCEKNWDFLSSEHDYNNDEFLFPTTSRHLHIRDNRLSKRLKKSKIQGNHKKLVDNDLERDLTSRNRDIDDECDILGRRLATHFRNMRPQQRLLAEKIVSDVCIHARMDQLTLCSGLVINLPNNFNNLTQQGTLVQNSCRESKVDQEVDLMTDSYMQPL